MEREPKLRQPEVEQESHTEEGQESDGGVGLEILEPARDKNFMVAFEGRTEEESRSYNIAIQEVLKEAGLNPFHQIGATRAESAHSPGHHGWEIWQDADRETMEKLIPQIQERAREIFEMWKDPEEE